MSTTHNSHAVQTGEQTVTHECWSCGDMRAAHFCNSCGKLQPPAPADYFAFFGLPRKLNVDLTKLEREFYQLSRKLHPDLFVLSTSDEQNWSLQKTSQLNDAYRTLRDPISRTEYLLKLEGIHFEEQSKAATEQARATGVTKQQAIPPELLEEVFELNMQLEEARMNKKVGEADENLTRELQSTRSSLQKKYDSLINELQQYWDEWDALVSPAEDGPDVTTALHPVLDKMVNVLNRRTYIRNLVRDVSEVLEG